MLQGFNCSHQVQSILQDINWFEISDETVKQANRFIQKHEFSQAMGRDAELVKSIIEDQMCHRCLQTVRIVEESYRVVENLDSDRKTTKFGSFQNEPGNNNQTLETEESLAEGPRIANRQTTAATNRRQSVLEVLNQEAHEEETSPKHEGLSLLIQRIDQKKQGSLDLASPKYNQCDYLHPNSSKNLLGEVPVQTEQNEAFDEPKEMVNEQTVHKREESQNYLASIYEGMNLSPIEISSSALKEDMKYGSFYSNHSIANPKSRVHNLDHQELTFNGQFPSMHQILKNQYKEQMKKHTRGNLNIANANCGLIAKKQRSCTLQEANYPASFEFKQVYQNTQG